MGTLHNQPPRDYMRVTKMGTIDLINEINAVSKETKLSFDQVLRVYELKEQERANSVYVANGNIHDEQMSGLADLISELNSHLEDISDNCKSNESF